MLPGRGALRSVTSAARRAPLTGQLGSSTRGFATGRIGVGRHGYLSTGGASPLTRLRSGAAAGSVAVGQIPSSSRALSLWGSSKKPEPPAAETASASATPQPEAAPPAQPAADVAAAADSTTATQSSGWMPWNWGSKPAPAPQASVDLPAQAPAEPAATAAAVSEPAATSAVHPDTVSADLSQIITSDLDAYGSVSAIPEKIGYLHTLGVDFGYGTTSMIQWLLEHVHVYSGLPWAGSILATTLVIRALLWKPILMGQEATTRLNIMKQKEPQYEKCLAAQKAAMVAGDHTGRRAAQLAMAAIEQRNGVNKFLPFVNFVQLPIGFGMYRILRSMSELPVPALETGGYLWFTNLAVPDPTWFLPFLGPLAMLVTMRVTNRYNNAKQKKLGWGLIAVMGPLGFWITSTMPAAVQLYFVAAALTGLFQTTLMFNPTFRRMTGLTPLPAPKDTAEPTTAEAKSFLDELKGSFGNVQEMARTKTNESAEKKAGQRSLTEEARLQAEYYESLRERMAELEKKMKRRP